MVTKKVEDFRRSILAVLLMMVAILSILFMNGVSVYADRSEVDAVTTMEEGQSEISRVCSQANNTCGLEILVYTSSDGLLTFSNKLYSQLDMQEKRDFMQVALEATQETSLGAQQKNKLYNFIAEQDNPTSAAIKYLKSDASADFVEAKAWFRPFSGVIGTVMGVICLVVFLLLGISCLFDCAYLCLPTFQALLEHGEDHKRPFGVSREAWKAMKDVTADMKYRNIMSVYFSRRIPVVIVCCICLGYIVSGQIYDILVFFIDAFASAG